MSVGGFTPYRQIGIFLRRTLNWDGGGDSDTTAHNNILYHVPLHVKWKPKLIAKLYTYCMHNIHCLTFSCLLTPITNNCFCTKQDIALLVCLRVCTSSIMQENRVSAVN